MSSDENKRIVETYIEVIWNQFDTSRIEELIDPSYGLQNIGRGRSASKKSVEDFHKAFPDLKIAITDIVGENDTVAAWMELEGTQQGFFRCYPPSNQFVKWWEVGFWRIEGGRIVSAKFGADMLGIRKAIGVIPPLPEDET